ncbi:MAG: four helix bundle protein [Bacteroidota bacterium]|nr:four helix bundle protein [Bacteroidota bacterium]MDP3143995.1 four helix bundle protein [Bacteroidota bacterium]MDP3557507.1 four helix bundle protein [Bacteroidota bacterium]
MGKIEKFEDIIAWQKALELSDLIYSHSTDGSFSKDYGLRDQIRRASVSVVSNIAEGFERESNNQFIYFLSISKASAGEIRAQLYIARNQNYISQDEFILLNNKVIEVSKTISGFIAYLKGLKKSKSAANLNAELS